MSPTPMPGAEAPSTGVNYAPPPPHRSLWGSIEHYTGQTLDDLVEAGIGSLAGVAHGAIYAGTHDPATTVRAAAGLVPRIAEKTKYDITHWKENPGQAAIDVLSFAPIPGAIAGRVSNIARISERAGELEPVLAETVKPHLERGDVKGAMEAARAIGRGGEFGRAVYQTGEKAGQVKPLGVQMGMSALTGPAREARLLRMPGAEEPTYVHGWWYSKDPSIRLMQKQIDSMYERYPEGMPPIWRLLPPFWRSERSRVGRAQRQLNIQAEQTAGEAARTYAKRFGKLADPMQMAVHMIVQGLAPDVLERYHRDILAGNHPEVAEGRLTLNPSNIAETNKRLDLINEAKQYITTERRTYHYDPTHVDEQTGEVGRVVPHRIPGVTQIFHAELPVLKPDAPQILKDFVDATRNLSRERESMLKQVGGLTNEGATARNIGPLQEIHTGTLPLYGRDLSAAGERLTQLRARAEKSGKENPEIPRLEREIDQATKRPWIPQKVADQLIQDAGLARVHYDIPGKGPRAVTAELFKRSYTGQSRPPKITTLTHPFEASILRHGGGDVNTARMMALTYSEAIRYRTLMENWLRIESSLTKSPAGIPVNKRILVRDPSERPLGGLGIPGRSEARRMMERMQGDSALSQEEAAARGMNYEDLRQELFLNQGDTFWDKVRGVGQKVADLARSGDDVEAPYGYKWADERTLGGLNKANPLVKILNDYPIARTAVRLTDALNTANKMAVLYLKPAYIFPNAMGNIFLNLIHQGFLAPWNIARSVATHWTMDPETRQGILASMGEGGMEALGNQPTDVLSGFNRLSRRTAAFYGRLVDEPFRIASFLHEARQSGFATRAELKSLVNDSDNRGTLMDVAQRANDAIVNYELLSPAEQAIARRLVFFYPWLKGSTRLVAQQFKERPLMTGAQLQAGRMQSEQTKEILGALPIYAEGLLPMRKPNALGVARVIDPSSASIMGEPADLVMQFRNLFSNPPNPSMSLFDLASPVDRLLGTLITAGAAGAFNIRRRQNESPFQSALKEYYQSTAPYQLYHQLRHPYGPERLYPSSGARDAILRWAVLSGFQPRNLNVPLANYSAWLDTQGR